LYKVSVNGKLFSGSVCVCYSVPVLGANLWACTADWWSDKADVKVYGRCPHSFCSSWCSRLAI